MILFSTGIQAYSSSEWKLMPDAGVELPCADVGCIVLMQNFDPFEWKHVHINKDLLNFL